MSSRFHNEPGVIHIANGKFSNEFFLKICRFVQWVDLEMLEITMGDT